MKRGLLLILITSLLLRLVSCKKDPVTITDFTRITAMNSSTCQLVGLQDSTDWTNDTTLNATEKSFIHFIDTLVVITDSTAGNVQLTPACPNPSDGLFHIDVVAEKECKMRVAIINTHFQIVYYNSIHIAPNSLTTNTIDLRGLTAVHKENYYRLYYGFLNARDSVYFRGHGDLHIE